MTKNERLVIVGKAFEDQIKQASTLLEQLFRSPVKAWLLGLVVQEREVAGCVKAYIQADKEHEVTDSDAVKVDLVDAIRDKQIGQQAIAKLLDDGVLCLGDPDKAAGLLQAIGSRRSYKHTVPAGGRPALRLNVTAKGRFEGLSKALKNIVDLPIAIQKAADDIENDNYNLKVDEKTTGLKLK
jgi:hypothetical protein